MNNIGFGIFCFGDEFYFDGTKNKIKNILDKGFICYVLTDNSDYFNKHYSTNRLKIIQYKKEIKSYHDKMILPKHILENHNICILIDADVEIFDYSFFTNFKTYSFLDGISYIETLHTHPSKMDVISKIDMSTEEWNYYNQYCKSLNIDISNQPTIWEYFLVINKNGFNQNLFYRFYERLQIAKDFCNLNGKKEISGMGEGVSITIASILSNTKLTLDENLFKLVQNKMVSVSRKFTNPNNLPDWIK
jgi:hypothetical protein